MNPVVIFAPTAVFAAAALACLVVALSAATRIRAEEDAIVKLDKERKRSRKQAGRKASAADARLASAGIDMSAGTWLSLVSMACMAAFLFGYAALSSGFAGLAAAAAVAAGSQIVLAAKRGARAAKFDEQLCRVLPQIGESMKSGLTLERSMASVAEHADEPLAGEFRRCAVEMEYNPNAAEAIEHMARRTRSKDLALLSAAAKIHQERGGNMAPTMEAISETMAKRLEMRRYVKSETANSKTSMLIVALFPILILAAQCAAYENYAHFYFGTTAGAVVIGICAMLEACGVAVMMKMANVKID